MHCIAIFGGSFDPVHHGHIQTSLAIQEYFHFNSYCFLPCKIPALKPDTTANSKQRVAMLRLAIEDFKEFSIELREIERSSPSYMSETLESIREEHKEASITLILGYDAFLSLPKWHHWKKIINLAHLLVINRTTFCKLPIPKEIKKLLSLHQSTNKEDLLMSKSGVIYEFDAGNYTISSTDIREELKQNSTVETKLPKKVYQYIKSLALYQ